MRSALTLRRVRGLLIATTVMAAVVAVTSGAAAQETDGLDLGSGWELRLEEPMLVGSMVAGSPESGFVVWQLESGDVFWSADGLEWQDPEASLIVRHLASTDRGFVAARNAEPVGSVLFSPDGRNWDSVDVGDPASFLRVESGPQGFLLVGEKSCAALARFSADGRDWVPVDLPAGCGSLLAAPMHNGWTAVALLDNEVVVLSSDDGINWIDIDAAAPPPGLPPELTFFSGFEQPASLSSSGQVLVLAGAGTEGMWVSVDEGDTWAMVDIDPRRVEMAVSDLGFVGVSANRVLFSANGTSWSEYPVELAFHDVAAAGDTLVALAPDGIYTWTAQPTSLPDTGTNTTPAVIIGAALIATGTAALAIRRNLAGSA